MRRYFFTVISQHIENNLVIVYYMMTCRYFDGIQIHGILFNIHSQCLPIKVGQNKCVRLFLILSNTPRN